MNRWMDILKALYEMEGYIALKDLAKQVNLSGRTIKKIILEYREQEEDYGFSIVQNSRKHYHLNIREKEKFQAFIYQEAPVNAEVLARIIFILEKLLLTTSFIRIEELAEALFVSRATLDRLMPKLKEIVQQYDLSIETKPKYGIRLVGEELNKRTCYAHEVSIHEQQENQQQKMVQEILYRIIKKYHLQLNDINFYNLVQHCLIAIHRIEMNNFVVNTKQSPINENEENERAAAKEIVDEFEKVILKCICLEKECWIIK